MFAFYLSQTCCQLFGERKRDAVDTLLESQGPKSQPSRHGPHVGVLPGRGGYALRVRDAAITPLFQIS